MNIYEFVNHIIKFKNVDDILNSYNTQSEKGIVFEKLFDVIIKFGLCNIFPKTDFNYLLGNSNNAKLKILKYANQYLIKKVFDGNASGCSDITLQNKNNNQYIFISSKYPKTPDDYDKQKSIDYYDIQNIIAMATENKHIYKNYKIYLLVPNKKQLLEKAKNAKETSKYITKHIIEENILDQNDLNKYFLNFKKHITKNIKKDLNEIYFCPKENLDLRFHQELITQKTSNLIKKVINHFYGDANAAAVKPI